MADLPETPSLEWLRKHARRRLADLKREQPAARLADAQLDVAREYGFSSWRAMKAHIDALSLPGALFQAARTGDVVRVGAILDAHPELLTTREPPYDWTLLHAAAQMGQVAIVDLLLARGLDVNAKEKGDDTTALHWAAAAGKVDVVKRLLDAGIDPVGAGDDHGLTAIGWASCWPGTETAAHREIVRLLLAAGARHTIFSAIGANDLDELLRMVKDDPAVLQQRMSKNENGRLPLHFAVMMNRAEEVSLLLGFGANPAATDDGGMDAMGYAAFPHVQPVTISALAGGRVDTLHSALAAKNEDAARRVIEADPNALNGGAMAFHAKRGDLDAVRWMLAHGADPDARWSHWGANVTAMHLAAMAGYAEIVRILLDAGGDPTIRDDVHGGDVAGWAEHHHHYEVVAMIREHLE